MKLIKTSSVLTLMCSWVGTFHVYAFALVSGYIFAFKMRVGGYQDYVSFLKNKVRRLLVPYFFTAIIWVVPISEIFFHWDAKYLFRKYVFCINPNQLWFLWMLFWVFAIVWPLYRMISSNARLGYILSVFFYGAGTIGRHIFPNVFCIWTAFQYVLFFYIGTRIRIREENGDDKLNSVPIVVWIVLDGILFLAYSVIGTWNGYIYKILYYGAALLLHIFGSLMAFFVLQKIACHINWISSKLFKVVSSNSMPIYLFHQQIIYIVIYFLNGVNLYVHAGINFIVSVFGALLISMVLMKWKITRFLIGEKLLS